VTLQSVFEWLESWPVSVGIRQSSWMFPAFESVHVIAMTLVVGSVMVVDLRVLGLASRSRRVSQLSEEILPWTWGAFVIALISGSFLLAAKAHTYFGNIEFQLKMAFMFVAALNMLVFHFVPYRTVGDWDLGRPAPLLARFGCGLSLILWILIVAMGRWIGFSIEG
jgi:uncharacterized membrane protein